MEWQPIETAPEDGTVVLLWGGMPDTSSDETDWFQGFGNGRSWRRPRPVSAWWDGYGWAYCSYDGGHYGSYEGATHWMLLPAPPSA